MEMAAEDPVARAAERIANADFILVAAGAGFSADSGLPVYNDIAAVDAYETQGLEYQDLCDPYWLEDDEQVFYGFWGNCLNAYRETSTHKGYEILRKWKTRLNNRRDVFQHTMALLRQRQCLSNDVSPAAVTNDPFFIYTSNVDAHFHRHFAADEIYELHGSLEKWQCAGSSCETVWTLPSSVRFAVDPTTMRADGRAVVTCAQCGGAARPNVLMFHDKRWLANHDDEHRYVAWEAVVEQMLVDDPTLKLVVLEIGCGMRVPSVRKETEMVVADVFARCGASSDRTTPPTDPQVSLIRINPDFPECDNDVIRQHTLAISLRAKGLEALEQIDALIATTVHENFTTE